MKDYDDDYDGSIKLPRSGSFVITNDKLRDNKFYIGSGSILDRHWGHPALDEAIAHAQQMLTDKQGTDTIFIVEIVRVVRRKKIDVDIEEV